MPRSIRRRANDWETRMLRATGGAGSAPAWLRELVGHRMTKRGFRSLAPSATDADGTPSADRINRFLRAFGGERYLEIGIEFGRTLEAVHATTVIGVDPAHWINAVRLPAHIQISSLPSDGYFEGLASGHEAGLKRFDLIFVDGLHTFKQSYRDVINSFNVLDDDGMVIVDDTIPSNSFAALPDKRLAKQLRREHGVNSTDWMGDVYRTVLAVARFHPSIEMVTVEDEHHRGQTFMWRRIGAEGAPLPLERVTEADLDTLLSVEFDEVLGAGVPEAFNSGSLEAAIEARRAARTAWQGERGTPRVEAG